MTQETENATPQVSRCDICGEFSEIVDLLPNERGNMILACRACQHDQHELAKKEERDGILGIIILIAVIGILVAGHWELVAIILLVALVGYILRRVFIGVFW